MDENASNRETWSGTRRAIFVLKFQLENHLYFLIKYSIPDLQAGCPTMSANFESPEAS